VRLEELATVGVRDGSTLIVTTFDSQVSLLSRLSFYQHPPYPLILDNVDVVWTGAGWICPSRT
jgi:hypothetical protein